MKHFIAALLLLSSAAANADETPSLPTLQMDLDGDAKPDLVRIVAQDKEFNRLEVVLSKSGATLSMNSLVRTTVDQTGTEEGSYCSGITQQNLIAGKGRSFVWQEITSDAGGCAGQLDRELVITLGSRGLEVAGVHFNSYSYSSGDPSPTFDLKIDLSSRKVRAESGDRHWDKVLKAKLALPASCGPKAISEFEREAYPACVAAAIKAISKKISLDCGRNEDSRACPVKAAK